MKDLRSLFPLFVLTLALAWASVPVPAQEAAPTTVIVTRHAEKATTPRENPGINLQGHARTARLVRLLERSEVTALYASEYRRTQETLGLLAEKFGLEVQVIPAKDTEVLAQAVLRHAGGVVVVAAHSNTVGAIIEALGGRAIPPIEEDDYDNLYVVTVFSEGQAAVLRLTY